MTPEPNASTPWWHTGTIYQIYPRSFQDSNGDGVGDLKGIKRRLSYLVDLGVDALWLSPIFASPMADFGYDISDYRAIAPIFGSMADFDALLLDAHDRGLKLLLDFVPNHTSDQHAWFVESRSSRYNPKRDWYIWRDPAANGGPPNNWISNFGGSAWTFDAATGQYYYHAFLKQQPDLNWRNPAVRAAMADILRFWLDKGVDGFRVDVIWHLIKDAAFRDNPPNPLYRPGQPEIERFQQIHSADQPEVHDVIAELRAVIDAYPGRLLIGEIYLPIQRLMTYYGKDLEGVNLPFNFQLLDAPWRAEPLAELIDEYESALPKGGWPNWVLSNHDRPRVGARVGDASARLAAMLLLTLRGTPTLYYGDELGIADVTIPHALAQDPWAKNEPDASFNRDKSRTPMQWSDDTEAGFTTGQPWLPLTNDWRTRNVSSEEVHPGSMLALIRELLALRRREPALQTGAYRRLFTTEQVFAYERSGDQIRLAIVLNLSATSTDVCLPEVYRNGEVLIRTVNQRSPETLAASFTLAAHDGLIIRGAAR